MRKMILLIMMLCLIGCGKGPIESANDDKNVYPIRVKYEVTGSIDDARITYKDEDGEIVILESEELPFEIEIDVYEKDYFFVTVYEGYSNGHVTAKVFFDDFIMDEQTAVKFWKIGKDLNVTSGVEL